MRFLFRRSLAVMLLLSMLFQMLVGCSDGNRSNDLSNTLIKEQIINEEFINEVTLDEQELQERYIIENLIFEEGIYEYKINESIISQAYIIETVISETSEEEILAQLPDELEEYDIDWAKVIGKFAIGTAVIIAVGVINYFSAGSTYFVFGSPATVAKDALIGGAIGETLNEIIRCAIDGKLVQSAAKKYAVEGFAEGYMWGAITSVLKIASANFKRLNSFKLATDGVLKIRADGSVFDDAGKLIGKAYYDKNGIWHFVNETTQTVRIFDAAGKELLSVIGNSLPANSMLRLGLDSDAIICYTDDVGQIIRMGNELMPNISYQINGYQYFTDKYGRIEKVVFDNLRLRDPQRGRLTISPTTDSISNIGRGYARANDHRGHLIGDLFDGDNTMANLVPMDGNINQGDVAAIERLWARCLGEGGNVRGSIEISYSGNSFRPDSFGYSYDIGNGMVSKIIANG